MFEIFESIGKSLWILGFGFLPIGASFCVFALGFEIFAAAQSIRAKARLVDRTDPNKEDLK